MGFGRSVLRKIMAGNNFSGYDYMKSSLAQ